MSKLYQIYDHDLAELERILPLLQDALAVRLDSPLRVKLRACKRILSDVRWGYGPPESVDAVGGGGKEDGPDDDGVHP